jgi:hypothetical protein
MRRHRAALGSTAALALLIGILGFANSPDWALARSDVHEMVAAIAARHVHGDRDGAPSVEEIDAIARDRPVVTTCTYVSRWAVSLLHRHGIRARTVSTITLDAWNDHNNGHTLIEAMVGGEWVAFDVDLGVRFTDHGGAPLSLAEWVARVPHDDYRIVPIEPGTPPAAELYSLYRRVAQVPLIADGKRWWFWSDQEARVLSYHTSYVAMDRAAWEARFYPDGSEAYSPGWYIIT